MKKDILIIAHFCSDFDINGNNRFNYIADLLAKTDFDVELVTSDYSHIKKKKRDKIKKSYSYKITFISEPGYSKNVSLKRFYSHYVMAINLRKYLKNRKKPDVIYCAVPSLDVAIAAAKYAKENKIRFIIDVQDLWPEAYKMIVNIPILSDLVFYPMKRKADYIYSAADEIVAVSETYANRALRVNSKCKSAHAIYLGTQLDYFDKLSEEYKSLNKPKDEIWLAYVGTLGHSYDLTCVIDSLKILMERNIKNIKFIVMGDGPLKENFEIYSKQKGINAQFTGRLAYEKMLGILVTCDIAVNPILHNAAASIINKHGDYAAAGLPVLNTQECEEYVNIVDKFQIGLNCNNNDANDLAEKLLILYNDEELRKKMGNNSRKLAERMFDRNITYQEIIKLIKKSN